MNGKQGHWETSRSTQKNPQTNPQKENQTTHPQDLLAFSSKEIVIIVISWKFKQNLDLTALGTTKARGKKEFLHQKKSLQYKKRRQKGVSVNSILQRENSPKVT